MSTSLITSYSQSVTTGQRDQCAQVVGDAAKKATRAMLDELAEAEKLNSPDIQKVLAVGGKIASAVSELVKATVKEIVRGVVGCLKLISADKAVQIGGTKGTETLATATDVFNYVDSDFKGWGCDGVEQPTLVTPVEVYELTKNADYRTIFGGFGQNLDTLCLTTPQIKSFVANQAENWLLEDGWAYFLFLFKVKAKKKGEKGEFFVASVDRGGGGSRWVYVSRFGSGRVWNADHRDRVVVPELALKS